MPGGFPPPLPRQGASLLAFHLRPAVRILTPVPNTPDTRNRFHGRLTTRNMTGIGWPQPHTRATIQPQPFALGLLLGHLQAFPAPQPLDPLVIHAQPFRPQQRPTSR